MDKSKLSIHNIFFVKGWKVYIDSSFLYKMQNSFKKIEFCIGLLIPMLWLNIKFLCFFILLFVSEDTFKTEPKKKKKKKRKKDPPNGFMFYYCVIKTRCVIIIVFITAM
jgi:NADH:ubiquinone oxidoreductase subunit 5 (subunit L)/multisubunit Na+/H+ antiporter MnhA subunit